MEILDFSNVYKPNLPRDTDVDTRQLLLRLPQPGFEVLQALSNFSGESMIEFVNTALWTEVARRISADDEERSLAIALLGSHGLNLDEDGIVNHAL